MIQRNTEKPGRMNLNPSSGCLSKSQSSFLGCLHPTGLAIHLYFLWILESGKQFYSPEKEAQEKALEEMHLKLRTLEDGMKDLFPEGVPEVNAEKLGLLDILIAATFGTYRAYKEVLGVKIIEPEKNPLLFSWVEALIKLPVVEETLPPHEKLIGLIQPIKEGIKISAN